MRTKIETVKIICINSILTHDMMWFIITIHIGNLFLQLESGTDNYHNTSRVKIREKVIAKFVRILSEFFLYSFRNIFTIVK